jgi:hypothetical protein
MSTRGLLAILLILLCTVSAKAQFTDNFTDGNFTAAPTWSGDATMYEVDGSFRLHLNDLSGSGGVSYLSTPSVAIHAATWEFKVDMTFNPSSANLSRVYLVSNNADLEGSLNGYFVMLGNTLDEVALYRQTGTTITKIIDGVDGTLNTATVTVRVQVTRDAAGLWTLRHDITGGTSYTTEGTVTDLTHTTSSYFGVRSTYSVTRASAFWYDDFNVTGTAIPDLTPPTVTSINAISSTQVEVQFSENVNVATATNTANYNATPTLGAPTTAVIDAGDSSLVRLTWSTPFAVCSTYTLTVSNVQDRAGNPLSTPATGPFSYAVTPAAGYHDIVINEIFADPDPVATVMPNTEFIELYNPGTQPFNLDGWTFSDPSATATLPTHLLCPGEYVVLADVGTTPLFAAWPATVLEVSLPSLNNSGDQLILRDNFGNLVDSVDYVLAWYQDVVKDDGGWSLELINPFDSCDVAGNWTASIDPDGGTPGEINSVYSLASDVTAPSLLSVTLTDSVTLTVCFDEAMDVASLTNIANYGISPAGPAITGIVVTSGNTCAVLTLSPAVTSGVIYTLTLSNMADCPGNTSPVLSDVFVKGSSPLAGEVVINEIFADPSPIVGLPESEFVELYNAGSAVVQLQGCTFTDGSATIATLGNQILFPGEYLILCPSADIAEWTMYGTVMGVASFPSLNNAGDNLELRSAGGTLIDKAYYTLSWYADAVKDDGGWTMERINPDDTCKAATNWAASVDTLGGTPGEVNSVYDPSPDLVAPTLSSVTLIDSVTVLVCFSEEMDVALLSLPGSYAVTGGLTVTSAVPSTDKLCVTLTLSATATLGVIYTVTITGMEDCAGNPAGTLSGDFVRGAAPVAGHVVFNEIFPDPSPTIALPGAEFVELTNTGTAAVQLGGCTFTDGGTTVTLPSAVLLPGEYLILCPVADVVEWSAYGDVLGLSPFPSLNNTSDSLELWSGAVRVDHAYYDLSWYQDAAKDDGGWTMERINPSDTCKGMSNWRASLDTTGGTPGRINSVYDPTPDSTPPTLSSVALADSVTLVVCFDEEMNLALLANISFYSVSGGLTVIAAVPSADKMCVTLTLSPEAALGVVYTLTIVSMEDCAGNPSGTLTGTFVRGLSPAPGQIIFNEIFPDPSPAIGLPEVEFVELFNGSTNVIQLSGCTFTDGGTVTTLPAAVMMPGEHLILCPDGNVADWSPFGSVLGVPSFPSLNNSGDSLELRTPSGLLIDHAYYTLDWYHDGTKDDGGWTIERINPTDTCKGMSNWAASVDASGGTPGAANSVYSTTPDITPPGILSTVLLDSVTVQVCFDEEMDVILLADIGNYTVSGGLTVTAAVPSADKQCVILTLSSPAVLSVIYTLTLYDLTDCAGNWPGTLTTQFVKGGPANVADVILNEIFPDPAPIVGLPEAEFVEIHNRSANAIDITDWQLTDRTATVATLGNGTLVPGGYLILCASADAADYAIFGPTMGLSNFPSLNNSGDSLELRDASGTLIDFVYYADEWYADDTKKEGGWTLERKDASFLCQNPGNWAASINSGGGTPGSVNSLAGVFVDSVAPRLTDAVVVDPSILRLSFSEGMDPTGLSDPSNYTIDNGVGNPLIVSADATLTFVDLLLGTPLDSNVVYCVTVGNVKDCPGIGIAPPDDQLCFGIPLPPAQGDLILNEILFNPYTGGADYVELVNVSNKIIDLQQVFIGEMLEGTDSIINSDPASDKPRILLPGAYVCLTEDKAFQLATYFPLDPDAIIEVADLPSYDDTEGECVISTGSKLILDRFHYLDDYHFANLDDKEGVSLERLSFVLPTQDPMNWHSAASTVRYGTPVYENSQQIDPNGGNDNVSLNPKVFSPDSDGQDDVVTINYQFDVPGSNVRVSIYDRLGRPVRKLVPNTLIGTEPGTFTWDGTDDNLHKVPVGPYILLFEMTNPNNGKTEEFKLTVIVAARF